MVKRTSVAILTMGLVGFVLMLFFYQQALKSGLNLEPIVKLRESVREGFDVEEVQVRRNTGGDKSSEASDGTYRLLIEVRAAPAVRREKELARRVLRYAVNHYDGERGPLQGIRVEVRPHDAGPSATPVTVEKRTGPPVDGASGS